jgi:type III secretion protein O
MHYPLAGLMKIRDFRVDAASKAVQAAEARLRVAREDRLEKEKELERYKRWREEEVERRYQSIMGRTMDQVEIDGFKAGLSRLADLALEKEEALREADRVVEEASRDAQTARNGWILANQERQKIEYHRDDWRKAQADEANRKEALEQEEFKPLLFEAAGESGSDDHP